MLYGVRMLLLLCFSRIIIIENKKTIFWQTIIYKVFFAADDNFETVVFKLTDSGKPSFGFVSNGNSFG